MVTYHFFRLSYHKLHVSVIIISFSGASCFTEQLSFNVSRSVTKLKLNGCWSWQTSGKHIYMYIYIYIYITVVEYHCGIVGIILSKSRIKSVPDGQTTSKNWHIETKVIWHEGTIGRQEGGERRYREGREKEEEESREEESLVEYLFWIRCHGSPPY